MHVSLNKSAEITLQFEQGQILHIKRKDCSCELLVIRKVVSDQVELVINYLYS